MTMEAGPIDNVGPCVKVHKLWGVGGGGRDRGVLATYVLPSIALKHPSKPIKPSTLKH
jgi:hypothetical protein